MTAERERSAGSTLERLGLTALAYPPFVTFFSANLLSNASWFIFSAALNTYVLALTGSAETVGFASFMYSLPSALFMLHAGLLTDRFGAKRLVVVAMAGAGIAICLIGLLALWEAALWIVIAIAFVMGVFQTLGSPGFISIVNDLVPPKAISSAVALTFLGFNVGRILGGLAGGILLAALGADPRFAAAATLVIAGILQSVPSLPIARITVKETVARTTGIALVRPLLEAAGYAYRNPTIGVITLLSVAPGAIGLSYMFLLPVVVRDLGAEPGAVGLLFVGGGIGGLLASLVAEPIMRRLGHGRAMYVGLAAVAFGLIGLGLATILPLAAVAVGLAQAGFAVYASSGLSLIQALSPARLRGRLTSLFTLLYWGLMPFGALLGGIVAERTSSLVAVALAGLLILACGALALLGRRQIATLRIARDGRSVSGDLRGSGHSPEPRPAAS